MDKFNCICIVILFLAINNGCGNAKSVETTPVQILMAISKGQEHFKDAIGVDQNFNGTGEYGFLQELGGKKHRIVVEWPAAIPFISKELSEVNEYGVCVNSGYCFIIYLPISDKAAISEKEDYLPKLNKEYAEFQEKYYLAYAWPIRKQPSSYLYFINQEKNIFKTKVDPMFGPENPPPWYICYEKKADASWSDSIGGKGWELVN